MFNDLFKVTSLIMIESQVHLNMPFAVNNLISERYITDNLIFDTFHCLFSDAKLFDDG